MANFDKCTKIDRLNEMTKAQKLIVKSTLGNVAFPLMIYHYKIQLDLNNLIAIANKMMPNILRKTLVPPSPSLL